jgi:O-antigen ligase
MPLSAETLVFVLQLGLVGLFTAGVIVSRSVTLLTIIVVGGTFAGHYVNELTQFPLNFVKIYVAALYLVAFVWLGHVSGFRTHAWEYLLLIFFVGRLAVDLLRPGFELRFPFGGAGDGAFLVAGYFYYKKAFLADPENHARLVRALVWIGAGLAAVGLVEAVTGTDLLQYPSSRFFFEFRHRANSLFHAPEPFGISMGFTLFLVWLLYREGRLERGMAVGLAMLLTAGLVSALYRTVVIAFLAATVFVYLVRSPRPRLVWMPVRGAAALVMVVGLWSGGQVALRNSPLYEDRIANPENWEYRVRTFEAVVEGVLENPWLGHGTGTVEEFLPGRTASHGVMSTPHSGYLLLTYENGLLLLLLYAAWVLVFLRKALAARDHASIACGAMLMMLLIANLALSLPLTFDYSSLILVVAAALSTARSASATSSSELSHGYGDSRRSSIPPAPRPSWSTALLGARNRDPGLPPFATDSSREV